MLKIRKEWRERNPDYFKKWRENNRDKVESYKPQKRKRAREIYKHRYNHDVNYRIRRISRSMLRRALNELGVSKNSPTCELLGYDRDMLREHLEDNFLDGMSWDNYGEVWEIDHATPISRMEEFGITSVREINSLGNLIPMYKEDNRDKLEKTLEEYLKDYPSKINLYGKFLK
ncbi:MAG: hypothetical protein CMF22_10680 [Idiomarinaceae bacterium]|nr:hypothetical protein [Idiomarinaceae bacterium]